MANPILKNNPFLLVKEIADQYLRQNFQNLADYFNSNNQLYGFKFFEVNLSSAKTNYQVAHGLGFIPLDIIVTRVTGSGIVTFNYGEFTSKYVSINATAACRVRFFVGSYWNYQSSIQNSSTDSWVVNPTSASSSTPSTSTSTTTVVSTSSSTTTETLTNKIIDTANNTIKSTGAAAGSVLTADGDGNTSWASQAAGASAPVGTLMQYAGTTAPTGFLFCRGQQVSRTTYSDLFAVLKTNYGAGDGSTTFNLPDLRGSVPRGFMDISSQTFTVSAQTPGTFTAALHGLNRSGVPVRVSSSASLPTGLSANTTYFVVYVDPNTFKLATTEANALAGTVLNVTSNGTGTLTVLQWIDPDAANRLANAPSGNQGQNIGAVQADQIGTHTHPPLSPQTSFWGVGSGGVWAGTNNAGGNMTTTGATGGNETRQRNISLNYIIKF